MHECHGTSFARPKAGQTMAGLSGALGGGAIRVWQVRMGRGGGVGWSMLWRA